jgi:murein DD-endopeptidase MepM/ murein hydrolase activator NlpD
MPAGPLLVAAGAGLSVAAILALKRRRDEQFFAGGGTLPPPATPAEKAAASGRSMPRTNTQGYAEYILPRGNFVRGLDMNRRTSAGELVPHWGIDLAAPTGTPVYAAKGGRVVHAAVTNGYGNNVQIAHDDGRESTLYAHLNSIHVREGQNVLSGYQIGTVGRSCQNRDGSSPAWCASMSPHLHMEVHPYATPRLGRTPRRLDPVNWLAQKGIQQAQRRV